VVSSMSCFWLQTVKSVFLTADRDARKRAEAAQRSRLAPLKRAVEKAERALEASSLTLEAVRERLTETDLYTDARRDDLAQLLSDESNARVAVEATEEALLDTMQALDDAQSSNALR